MSLAIRWQTFAELSGGDLYRALVLRQMVFVVEQNCPYLDADGLDEAGLHGLGHDQTGALLAVARILPPGSRFPLPSIGRIAVARQARRLGYGRLIFAEALAQAERRYPASPIQISAQAYLERFYQSFGFVRCGDPFDEDGIPHLAMVRDAHRLTPSLPA
jgi:ElaA protein